MLTHLAELLGGSRAAPAQLGVTGMTESDVQTIVVDATRGIGGVGFTVLSRPGDVRAILIDEGGGESAVSHAADLAATALGDECYTRDGSTLAEVVVSEYAKRTLSFSLAESCTGGMVTAAVTDVAGSSAALLGGVVSYSDAAKTGILGVGADTLERYGAVSAETAREMAAGSLERFGSDIAVSVTGIAGPDGGTEAKPVGTVWFGVAARTAVLETADGPATRVELLRRMGSDRASVRLRSTAFALDLLRRAATGLPLKA
jgi:nicotinamide-nucleotide amidase